MIQFAQPSMQRDFPNIHPDLHRLLLDFWDYSEANALPTPVVTDLVRSPSEQERIYVAFYAKLQQAMTDGPHAGLIDPENDGSFRPLTTSESKEAHRVLGMSHAQLTERARNRFTWHWVKCAADLRTRHYSKEQLAKVTFWFGAETSEKRVGEPLWECLVHDVTAPHLHVGRRDEEWKRRFMPPFDIA